MNCVVRDQAPCSLEPLCEKQVLRIVMVQKKRDVNVRPK